MKLKDWGDIRNDILTTKLPKTDSTDIRFAARVDRLNKNNQIHQQYASILRNPDVWFLLLLLYSSMALVLA